MRQYFTGFFTAVCLTASVFIFMGSQNKNLGDIEADSISLTSELGTTYLIGGGITFENKDGKDVINIGISDDDSGFLSTYNADGKETSFLGTDIEGSGALMINNMDEQLIAGFGASPDNGKDGEAVLFDRYGDIGWSASGKQ